MIEFRDKRFDDFKKEIRKKLIEIDIRNHKIFNYINLNEEYINNKLKYQLEISIKNYIDERILYIYSLDINEDNIIINDSYENNENNDFSFILNYIQYENNENMIIELIYHYLYQIYKMINELN